MIGSRIKEAREYKNLTQEQLSKEIFVSKRTLINYEKDKKDPTVSTIIRIIKVCGVRSDWILFGYGDMFENEPIKKEDAFVSEPKPTYDTENKELVSINNYGAILSDNIASENYGGTAQKMDINKSILRDTFNVKSFLCLDIVRIIGDTLSPVIKNGEVVIIERDAKPNNGDTILTLIDGDIFIRVYEKIAYSKYFILRCKYEDSKENRDKKDIIIDSEEKLRSLKILGILRFSGQVI